MGVKEDNTKYASNIQSYRPASFAGLTSSTKCLTPYLTPSYNSRNLNIIYYLLFLVQKYKKKMKKSANNCEKFHFSPFRPSFPHSPLPSLKSPVGNRGSSRSFCLRSLGVGELFEHFLPAQHSFTPLLLRRDYIRVIRVIRVQIKVRGSEWAVAAARSGGDGGQGCCDSGHNDLQDKFPDVLCFHSFSG